MTTLHLKKSSRRSFLRRGFLLIPLALACFALSLTARAVDPPPDGGYPNSNTAEGEDALFDLGTGFDNTAVGFQALFSNTSGAHNTATGSVALWHNTIGSYNTANGAGVLFNNSGSNNTANGFDALAVNTTGNSNTANGFQALVRNTTGSYNTANGFNALVRNTTGSANIALGREAGLNLTTGSNNIDIANQGVAGEANTIRIGKQGTQTATFIAGISGATVPTGVAVIVDSDGHLGTVVSSERFKDGIKPMDKASEAILALKPVLSATNTSLIPMAFRSSVSSLKK